jgi:hypothetical protein
MDLTEVRLRRITRYARTMLHRHSLVSVGFDAEARDQVNTRARRLTERVPGAPAHRGHDGRRGTAPEIWTSHSAI